MDSREFTEERGCWPGMASLFCTKAAIINFEFVVGSLLDKTRNQFPLGPTPRPMHMNSRSGRHDAANNLEPLAVRQIMECDLPLIRDSGLDVSEPELQKGAGLDPTKMASHPCLAGVGIQLAGPASLLFY